MHFFPCLFVLECNCVSSCVQFADGILAACLFILEKSQASASGWGDPVNIVRLVSAMVSVFYSHKSQH